MVNVALPVFPKPRRHCFHTTMTYPHRYQLPVTVADKLSDGLNIRHIEYVYHHYQTPPVLPW